MFRASHPYEIARFMPFSTDDMSVQWNRFPLQFSSNQTLRQALEKIEISLGHSNTHWHAHWYSYQETSRNRYGSSRTKARHKTSEFSIEAGSKHVQSKNHLKTQNSAAPAPFIFNTAQLPCGKQLHNFGISPCYYWVNPLFLWSFS